MTQKPSAATNIQAETYSRPLWSWTLSQSLIAMLFVLPLNAQAVDTLCAKVKIEIEIVQELTMERQAFDAKMKIANGLTTNSLDKVNINVTFADELGNSVKATSDPADTSAAFFIRIDTMTGISNVTGMGVWRRGVWPINGHYNIFMQ